MTHAAEDLRGYAGAIKRLAASKLDFTRNPNAIKRYAHDPRALAGMAADANEALKGAALLDQYAAVIDARKKGAA